jgi:hypothetical protein
MHMGHMTITPIYAYGFIGIYYMPNVTFDTW